MQASNELTVTFDKVIKVWWLILWRSLVISLLCAIPLLLVGGFIAGFMHAELLPVRLTPA